MALIQRFIDICLLRAGPADVPCSVWLLKLLLLIYFITNIIVTRVDYPWSASIAASVADSVLLLLVVYLLLYLKGMTKRFIQTVSALAGTSAVLSVIALPVLMSYRALEPLQNQLTSLALLGVMMVIFWRLFVIAHIFRLALVLKPGHAAILTVGYILLSMMVAGTVISGVA